MADVFASFARDGEDIDLLRAVGDVAHGLYVDATGVDPEFSLTRVLSSRGWRGVVVQPDPVLAGRARSRRADDSVIEAALGDRDAQIETTRFSGLGLIVDPVRAAGLRAAGLDGTEVTIAQRSLDSILHEVGAAVGFVHVVAIDDAWCEAGALDGLDLATWRPWIVAVGSRQRESSVDGRSRADDVLTRHGYRACITAGPGRLYVAEEHAARGERVASGITPPEPEGHASGDLWAEPDDVDLRQTVRALAHERDDLRERLRHVSDELTVVRRRAEALQHSAGDARARESAAHADAELAQSRLDELVASPAWRAGRAVAGAAETLHLRSLGRSLGGRLRRSVPAAAGSELWSFPRIRQWNGALAPLADAFSHGRLPATAELNDWLADLAPDSSDVLLTAAFDADERDALNLLRLAMSGRQSRAPQAGIVVVDVRRRIGTPGAVSDTTASALEILAAIDSKLDQFDEIVVVADHPRDELAGVLDDRHPVLARRATVKSVEAIHRSPIAADVYIGLTGAGAAPLPECLTRATRAVAFVHDLAGVSFPRHEPRSAADSIRYGASLVWLRSFDDVWCGSQSLADDLAGAVGIEPARLVLFDPVACHTASTALIDESSGTRVLVYGEGGAGANLLTPIQAMVTLRGAWEIELACDVSPELLAPVLAVAEEASIRTTVIDGGSGALADAIRRSDIVVVPSHTGGTSFGIGAAVVGDRPVLASSIDEHRQLLGDGPWLVNAVDVAGWAAALGAGAAAATEWKDGQRTTWTAATTGRRPIAEVVGAPRGTPHARRRRRPSLAVISPLPPQRSGVADYSAFTLPALGRFFDVSFVSNAVVEVDQRIGPVRDGVVTTRIAGAFDHTLHVLGNSHFHVPALEHLIRFGGAALGHDSRMSGVYLQWRGREATAGVMSMNGAEVTVDQVDQYVFDLERSPDSCYGEIADIARPLFVHSRQLADLIATETGTAPVVLPFCPYRVPADDELTVRRTTTARRTIGSFGEVNFNFKRHDLMIEMIGWLVQRDVDVELVVVGGGPDGEVVRLHRLADDCGIGDRVTVTGRVNDAEYRWWLRHLDAAVQVRSSSRPTLSGAVLDAVAYGLPLITTAASAAEVPDAPLLHAVPDRFTSTQLADAAQLALATVPDATAEEARRAFLSSRSVTVYTELIAAAILEGAA